MLKSATKTRLQRSKPRVVSLASVLDEIRGLRHDLALIIPTERIMDYDHPQTIIDAYTEAKKQFPSRA